MYHFCVTPPRLKEVFPSGYQIGFVLFFCRTLCCVCLLPSPGLSGAPGEGMGEGKGTCDAGKPSPRRAEPMVWGVPSLSWEEPTVRGHAVSGGQGALSQLDRSRGRGVIVVLGTRCLWTSTHVLNVVLQSSHQSGYSPISFRQSAFLSKFAKISWARKKLADTEAR